MDEKFAYAKEILKSYQQITLIEGDSNDSVHFELFGVKYAIFLEDDEFPIVCNIDNQENYPHILFKKVSINGRSFRRICLYEEGTLIEYIHSFEEKVRLSIDRLIALCTLTPQEVVNEYQKEFLVYWKQACFYNNKYFKNKYQLYLKNPQQHQWLEQHIYPNQKIRFVEHEHFFNDSDKRLNVDKIPVLYIPIIDNRNIIPPLPGKPWSGSEINTIVGGLDYQHISSEAYHEIAAKSYSHNSIILVFKLNSIYFGCVVEFANPGTAKLAVKFESQIKDVIPIVVSRCDFSYLNEQIGNTVSSDHVVIVGVGSLGSYIAAELIKAGFRKFTFIDGDVYEYDNTFRHSLHIFMSGINKAELFKLDLCLVHPEIEITAINKYLDVDNLDTMRICLADIIIFTVGSSDVQLRLNKAFISRNVRIPIYYAWLEHDGETCHIAAIRNYEEGCFECIYTDINGNHSSNSLNIASKVPVSYIRNGCGGTRVPYGNKTLLTASATMIMALQDKKETNQVYSFAHNKLITEDFPKNKRCRVCGIHE